MEKLFVTRKALNFRRTHKEIFNNGEYLALSISPGDAIGCAYARHFHSEWLLVIVPLAVARGREWTEESVHVPAILFGTWINVFTGKQITVTENLFLREAMREFPLCLLTRVED